MLDPTALAQAPVLSVVQGGGLGAGAFSVSWAVDRGLLVGDVMTRNGSRYFLVYAGADPGGKWIAHVSEHGGPDEDQLYLVDLSADSLPALLQRLMSRITTAVACGTALAGAR